MVDVSKRKTATTIVKFNEFKKKTLASSIAAWLSLWIVVHPWALYNACYIAPVTPTVKYNDGPWLTRTSV